jgi:hypothetical protein
MIRNTLAISFTIYALFVVVILKECTFLAPLRRAIWETYERQIVCFSVVLLLNLCATVFGLLRKVMLKDTGDKLAHLEKQLRGRATISGELTERILDRK